MKSKLPQTNLTLRQLGTAIGVKHQQLSREARRDDFPFVLISGRKRFDPVAVTAWREMNVRSRQTPPPAEPSIFPPDDPSIVALEKQAGSAVSVSRSILSLASRDLARRFKKGNVGATQLDALNKTLARLVAVEADALRTAERMGMLMHRDQVFQVCSDLANRFIRAFSRLEAEIATEALLWRKLGDMPSAEYSRKVREFVQKHAREIRAMEAADIQAQQR
jgi:hypothetical protein